MNLFISYSRKDTAFADALVTRLEQAGFTVWIDRASITGGDDWIKSIVTGIDHCDVFLIVLSPSAVASNNVKKEVLLANQKEKRIIPLRHQACDLSESLQYLLNDLQWIDFQTAGFDNALTQLVNALHGKASATPPVHTPAPAQTPTTPTNPPPTGNAPLNLYGRWQVLTLLMNQWTVIGDVALTPAGFSGQINTAQGLLQIQGNWNFNGLQVYFQGQAAFVAMPYSLFPYNNVVTVTGVQNGNFMAMDATGAVLSWMRVG